MEKSFIFNNDRFFSCIVYKKALIVLNNHFIVDKSDFFVYN